MFVGRRAAAEESESTRAGVPQLMLLAGRNGDRVALAHHINLPFQMHSPRSGCYEIYFLGPRVIVLESTSAHRDPSLGEALVADGRIPICEQFTNFGTVFRNEGR